VWQQTFFRSLQSVKVWYFPFHLDMNTDLKSSDCSYQKICLTLRMRQKLKSNFGFSWWSHKTPKIGKMLIQSNTAKLLKMLTCSCSKEYYKKESAVTIMNPRSLNFEIFIWSIVCDFNFVKKTNFDKVFRVAANAC